MTVFTLQAKQTDRIVDKSSDVKKWTNKLLDDLSRLKFVRLGRRFCPSRRTSRSKPEVNSHKNSQQYATGCTN